MMAARDFKTKSTGINDGLWCQSAMNVSDIGNWQLPDGSAAPDDLNAKPIRMVNKPGQVGLLRTYYIPQSHYWGMYTCTTPDENGITQTLVVWAAQNRVYDGSKGYCEFYIWVHGKGC